MRILRFDWLIGVYLFMSLVRNASFLIVKNSCVKEGRGREGRGDLGGNRGGGRVLRYSVSEGRHPSWQS